MIDQISISGNTEIAQTIKNQITIQEITPLDFGFDFKSFKYIVTTQNQNENLKRFIMILVGNGNQELKQAVAMEVALNLSGLGIINDLKKGADLALETINSGAGIKVLEDLVVYSGGDKGKFNSLVNKFANHC